MMNKRKEDFLKTVKADKLRLKTYGFIHIPKTGGTGISKFGRKVMAAGGQFPITFPHGWSAPQILKEFPRIKLCFVIRDPLERSISGINSRLRMGRPQYNSIWTVGEAVSFSFFPSAIDLLNGLASPDERTKSAAIFAFDQITHLKHGYEFYFKDVEFIKANRDRFAIVNEIKDSEAFVTRLCAETGIASDLLDAHYRRMHVSPQSTRSFVAELSPETIAASRKQLAREYEIHEQLKLLATPVASS